LLLSLTLTACAAAGGPLDTPVSPADVESTPSWLEPAAAPPTDGFEIDFEPAERPAHQPTEIPATRLGAEHSPHDGSIDGGTPQDDAPRDSASRNRAQRRKR
jgi:hypothetical protein